MLCLLFCTQHLGKGFIRMFQVTADNYIYALYGLNASAMQIFTGVTQLPWAMKPFIGLLSDVCPILGYSKAPYIIIFSMTGVGAMFVAGVVQTAYLPVVCFVVCSFIAQFQLSTNDLLSEAKYAEKINENPASGPNILTFVWFFMVVCELVAVFSVGAVITYCGPKLVYVICAVLGAVVIVPVGMGYTEEAKMTRADVERKRQKFVAQWEVCLLCVALFTGTVVLTTVALTYDSVAVNFWTAVSVATAMICIFSFFLSPTLAKFNAFSLVQTSLSLSTSSAGYYFFIDLPDAYPKGPHFSPFFYSSVLTGVGGVCSLIGIVTYQRYLSSWSYRNLLQFANVVYSVLSLLDCIIYSRVNVSLGIPDHVFCLSTTVLSSTVYQWYWMPQVVILAQLCPKGMEATLYALLAGCHNLGSSISSNAGAYVLQLFGCEPSGAIGETAQFANLWKVSAIAVFLPFVSVVLSFYLIPDGSQMEAVVVGDEAEDATAGSVCARWWRKGPKLSQGTSYDTFKFDGQIA